MSTPDATSPRSSSPRATVQVLSLLERPLPWPDNLLEETRDAVLEVVARLERLGGAPGETAGVQLSPHLRRAVEAIRTTLAGAPPEGGM